MPINAPWNYPTLMCTPPGGAGGVFPTETVLPLEAEAYAVTQEGEIRHGRRDFGFGEGGGEGGSRQCGHTE